MAQQQQPPPPPPVKEYKLLLVGDGKKELLKRFVQLDEFFSGEKVEKTKYVDFGVDVYPLQFFTNNDSCPIIKFNVWDLTRWFNSFIVRGLWDAYFAQGQCAIILFDVTLEFSYKQVPYWYRDVNRMCGDIPIVVCGSQCDIADRRTVKREQITFPSKKGLAYFDTSVKYNHNVLEMFRSLARKFTADPTLQFIPESAKVAYLPPLLDEVKPRIAEFLPLGILHDLDYPDSDPDEASIPDQVQERLQPSALTWR